MKVKAAAHMSNPLTQERLLVDLLAEYSHEYVNTALITSRYAYALVTRASNGPRADAAPCLPETYLMVVRASDEYDRQVLLP